MNHPPFPTGTDTPVMVDIGEKCAVFGVFAPDSDVSRTTYRGLLSQQHRGQDASGMVVADGDRNLHMHKELGLVEDVYQKGELLPRVLPVIGRLAIGHNRYGTQIKVRDKHRAAQPMMGALGDFALAYNGDIANIHGVMADHDIPDSQWVSDTEAVTRLVDMYAGYGQKRDVVAGLRAVLPQLDGAYSLVMTDGRQLIGARDPKGFRPFVHGEHEDGGHVLASEIRALNSAHAAFKREIEPGELVMIDEDGVRSERFAPADPKACIYEYIYFSKEENVFHDQQVGEVRRRFGYELAREFALQADAVFGVPQTGIAAAEGYAEAMQVPYMEGIRKREGAPRAFIANTQDLRELIANSKFIIDADMIRERNIRRTVVIDDSVIRGTNSRIITAQLRAAGVEEVFILSASPAYRYPCYYGMDTGRTDELLATGRTYIEMRDHVGADFLGFLSAEGVRRAAARPMGKLCMACTTGDYPTSIPAALRGIELSTAS